MTDENREFEDLLQATDMDDRIDPDFQSHLRRRMLETFQQAGRHASRSWWSRPAVRMRIGVTAGVAAGLLLVAIGWFGIHPAATPPDLSFADVQQRVQQMNAVQYRQTVTFAAPEGPAGGIAADVVNVDARRWQVVKPDGEVLESGSASSTAPEMRFASDRTTDSAVASTQPSGPILRVLDELLAARPESVTSTGVRRVINDRPAVSYSIERPRRTTEVWVDTQTQLPVLVQDVPADKSARVTASDLYWTPRDSRGGTILKLRTRPAPPATRALPEGKILIVPTGGNIDHMPMMAIPEGCKILIPGTPDRDSGPSARSREEAQARGYQQRLQEEIRRQGSAGTRPAASQTQPSPADLVVRTIAVRGDPEFVVERLRKILEARYGGRVAPKIVAVVPGTDGHIIIVQGNQEQVDKAEGVTRSLDEHAMRLKPRPAATFPSHSPAPAPEPDKFDVP